jgi:selenocysteine lyase/cysteine desulfurase
MKRAAVLHNDNAAIPWTLRLFPHYYNTEEEIESVVETLDRLL